MDDVGASLDAPAVDVGTDLGAPADAGALDVSPLDVGDDTHAVDVGGDTAAVDAPATFDTAPDVPTTPDVPTVPDVPVALDVPLASDVPVTPDDSTPTVLHPIAPLTGAHAPSRRPTLRWALPAGVGGVRVTLCRNRALTTSCITYDATGTSGAPTADLAPGVWYWSLRALTSGAPTGAATAVWRLRVASATTAGARPWGGDPDFNGDGYADVLVTEPQVSVSVYDGGPTGLATTPRTLVAPLDSTGFARSADFAGDFDGDGYGDLVVGSPDSDAVYLYRGSPGGVLTVPTAIVGPRSSLLGTAVAGAGDVDGDGYDDVVTTNPGGAALWVLPGGAAGVGTPVRVGSLSPPPSAGSTLLGVGDVDGDGFADVVLGSRLLRGAATGFAPGIFVDSGVVAVGDLNNDGLADLASQFEASRSMRVVPGARTFTNTATNVPGSDAFSTSSDQLGRRGGDYNGDGYDDLVGYNCIVPGGPTGPGTPVALMSGFGTATTAGMLGAGDVDGDGYDDALSRRRFESLVYLTRGTAAGLVLGRLTYTDLRATDGTFDATQPPLGVGDIDHDGRADLALGRTFFRGSAAGFVRAPTWTVGRAGEAVSGMTRVGDVNRDGYDDVLAFGREAVTGGTGWRFAYFITPGSPTGPTGARYELGTPTVEPVMLPVPVSFAGYAGDFNGDGSADGLLPGYGFFTMVRASYFTGRATFPTTTPTTEFTRLNPTFAGDLNRDGYADLLYTDSAGIRRVLLGSATGPVEAPTGSLASPNLSILGDVNGDGYADLGLGVTSGVEIHLGSAAGASVTASAIFTGGYSFGAVGDVNGDGYGDCVGASTTTSSYRDAWLYVGSATGPTSAGALRAPDEATLVRGFGPIGFGDVDGDGRSDLVLRNARGVTIQRFDAPGALPTTLTIGTGSDVVYR